MDDINPALTGKLAESARAWVESDWPEMASFIGPNAERFAKAWAATRSKALNKGMGTALSWCWPAFFFNFAWFFYRRMWVIGAVMLIVPFVLGYVLRISNGGGGVIGVIAAMYAKSLLVQTGNAKIAKIKASGGGYDEIAAAGGVSVVGGAIGGVIYASALGAVIVALYAGVPIER